MRCMCGKRFTAETENEAFALLHRHVADLGESEPGEHGFTHADMAAPTDTGMILKETVAEIERLLTERLQGTPHWSGSAELWLAYMMIRYAVMHLHTALHEPADTWRSCRMKVCMYAQFILPDVPEVQWTKGGEDHGDGHLLHRHRDVGA